MNPERFEIFSAVYRKQLARAIKEHPEDYPWAHEDVWPNTVDEVADRMLRAVERGSYNKDGYAFKYTCKALGIKYTYTAISSFLKGD